MDASIFTVCTILRYQKRPISQVLRQTLASYSGKRLVQVTVALSLEGINCRCANLFLPKATGKELLPIRKPVGNSKCSSSSDGAGTGRCAWLGQENLRTERVQVRPSCSL